MISFLHHRGHGVSQSFSFFCFVFLHSILFIVILSATKDLWTSTCASLWMTPCEKIKNSVYSVVNYIEQKKN